MTVEESLREMLLETAQVLEGSNLLEFLSTNAYAWYQQEKLNTERDFSPAENFILEQAGRIKK